MYRNARAEWPRGERGTRHDSLDLVAQERDGLGIAVVHLGDVQAQKAQLAYDQPVVPEAPHSDVVEVARAMDRRARGRLGDHHPARVALSPQRLGQPCRQRVQPGGRVAPDPEPRTRDGTEIGAGLVAHMIAAAKQGEIALCEPPEKGAQFFERMVG